MIKIIKNIIMKREAVLFDAPLFILKSFIAIMAGYALFNNHPLIGKDMISVLFGLILTLQPVNVSGLKSGWDQVSASLIGGVVTSIIVLIGGVNFITVPLAVALTLYITLRINWRSMSVIAVFTSIYMTQFIQLTAGGDPSMLLTFRLRLLALGSGVLIAIIVNFVFSLIFYRSMVKKRTIFTIEKIIESIIELIKIIKSEDRDGYSGLEKKIVRLFSDIDYIVGGLMDLKRKNTKGGRTEIFIFKLRELRDINHFVLDIVMLAEEYSPEDNLVSELEFVASRLISLDEHIKSNNAGDWPTANYHGANKNIIRINNTLNKISAVL